MAYCEVSEVREMIKEDALSSIIGDAYIEDETERETKIAELIEQAVGDADAEIDGYLAKRYPVPLSPVPNVITKMSKDIAVYNLFSRTGIDENSREKNYLTRYQAAIAYFKLIADGKVDLGVGSTAAAVPSGTGFRMHSAPRVMSRDRLRGM